MLHKSQIVLWALISFIAGTAQAPFYSIVVIGIITIATYRFFKMRISVIVGTVFIIFMCGAWWLGVLRFHTFAPDTSTIPYNETIQFTGLVSKPPITTADAQKLYIETDALAGKVYVKTSRYPIYQYGDEVDVSCTLLQPEPFDTFAYDKYLARHGVFTICQQARLKVIGKGSGNAVYTKLYQLRDWVRAEIRVLWPEPIASLLLGVILGIQDDIPEDIVAQFRDTGTIHVLVVSGMHVMIIAQLLASVGQRWWNQRQLVIIVGLVLAGFCIITGLAASVVRASIMGCLPLLAKSLGRKPVMHYSLIIVAAAMTMHNPYIVLYDAGFQLSFLATIGLVYFQPMCDKICWWIPKAFTLRETLSTTLAASIPTTPLVIATFGMFSAVSPLANLVVVPVSNLMLFGGTFAVLLSQALPPLGVYIAFIINFPIHIMLMLIELFGSFEFSVFNDLVVPAWFTLGAYGLIGVYIIWSIHLKNTYFFQ